MHLLTPVRATYEEDIRVRHDFLNSARDLFEVGFEVILPGGYEGDLKQSDTIRRNLAEYSENDGFFLALHAPLERTNYQESPMDLTTERGMDTLIEVLRLANQINARIVNVHSEYMRTEDALLGVYYDDIKLRLREAIVKNIAGAYTAASYRGIIALENSPLPAMGDDHSFKSKEAMLFEPLIDSPYGMKFFSDRGTYLCFDTCHADITARTLSAMVEGSDPRFGALELSDVYNLPIAETMPEPMTATLKGLNTVKYIHFSASRGLWIPGKESFEEGVVPGEGESSDELARVLQYAFVKNVPLLLEVNDKDKQNLLESRRGLAFIIRTIQKEMKITRTETVNS